jgi:hypothetical protein
MEPKPNPQLLYTPKALEACEKALRTILKKIGPWGTQLVLIGRMTPKYLVGNAPKEIKEHVGTTDLDVVVGVSLSTEEEEAYRTLQQNLKDSGFAPGKNQETAQEETFRWERNVDGVKVALEFFLSGRRRNRRKAVPESRKKRRLKNQCHQDQRC